MDTVANFTLNSTFCNSFDASRRIFFAWTSVYLLFLPVFLLVLYIGFNKWKKPQSSASGGLTHSDVFTLNMVAMEMIKVIGACIGLYGLFGLTKNELLAAENMLSIIFTGQMLFHSLTCVERYLAVVHPVTYLRLRGEGGVTIRNFGIALVWVISTCSCLVGLYDRNAREICSFALLLLFFPPITYTSVYVLCVLTRPKPGEGGGHRRQIDQSKRTTVYTMMAILGVLLMRLIVSVIVYLLLYTMPERFEMCVISASAALFCLPSSLVLPLLFLHRQCKRPGCCKV